MSAVGNDYFPEGEYRNAERVDIKMNVPGFQMNFPILKHYLNQTEEVNTDNIFEEIKELDRWDTDWDSYNIFTEDNDDWHNLRYQLAQNIGKLEGYKVGEWWVNGWVNKLEPGDSINMHFHSAEMHRGWTAVLYFEDGETPTILYPPWGDRFEGPVEVIPKKGLLMFCPQWLWHEVPPSRDQTTRYTLGIDIYSQQAMDHYWAEIHPKDPSAQQHATRI